MKRISKVITSIVLTTIILLTHVVWVSAATPRTSYELTVELFNKLLDDEKVINSFYTDINHTYPNPGTPKDLDKVAEFGKELTKDLTDNYQKAKTIYDWFEKNFTYNNDFYNQKYALHDKYISQGLSDFEAWVKTSEQLDAGPTGDISDRLYNSFVNRTGICLDYMKLFEIMAVGAGIPTDEVFGQDHMWNIFWYDKEKRWVLLDATWHEFDMPIEDFTKMSENHYVISNHNDSSGLLEPKFYNYDAEYYDTVALYKGEKQGDLPLRTGTTGNLIKTYIATTYDELLTAINVPDNDNNRRNIIIQGNITIPLNTGIAFKKCNVYIDEGYTVTSSGTIFVSYGGESAAVLNVKGTLAFKNGGSLNMQDYGTLNLIDNGKLVFEKNTKLDYMSNNQIVGFSSAPSQKGTYYWDGSKFFTNPVKVYQPSTPVYSVVTKVSGVASSSKLVLNGQAKAFPAVNIGGHNWIKLRDMAMFLNGTKKQFSLDYDSKTNTVAITSGKAYVPAGGELTEFIKGQVNAATASQKFVYNGKEVNLSAYIINNRNYLMLRDLAILLDFNITWNGTANTITLDVEHGYGYSDITTVHVIPASGKPQLIITKDKDGVIHESMDYVFEQDKDVIGKWEAIDFVGTPDDFDSKNVTKKDYIETNIRNFYENGREAHYADKGRGAAITQWTKGYVWGSDDVIEEYEIKQLDGKTFMFMQFKSGDYTVRGQKPNYYVYVKTSDTPDPEFAK